METIKAQVRRNKETGWLELFYIETARGMRGQVTSFCFQEGHNTAADSYRIDYCSPIDDETAKQFAQRVENYYNSLPDQNCKIQVVKRLTR